MSKCDALSIDFVVYSVTKASKFQRALCHMLFYLPGLTCSVFLIKISVDRQSSYQVMNISKRMERLLYQDFFGLINILIIKAPDLTN